MSFGARQQHHRFFTAPKIRSRHVEGFISPQFNRQQRYQSVGTFNNPHQIPQYHQLQQSTMKQSFLRLVNNGINSRVTKDELGYEGLKFQKDVINRYSQNDYKKNSQMLQKFKKQAQELKRKKKYRHVNLNNNSNLQQYSLNNGLKSYRQQYSRFLPETLPNHSISLLPVTNNSSQKASFLQNNSQINNNNASRISKMLPQLKLTKYPPTMNDKNFYDPVIEQDESTNQFLKDGEEDESPFLSRVCDVGVNAHLSIQTEGGSHRRRTSQKLNNNYNDSNLLTRKKSQSLKLQLLKSKNKHLKKKYDKLKKQLTRKSRQLSLEREKQKEEQNQKQFERKIGNLSEMIHNLCDKLKQNNSKLLVNANIKQQENNHQEKQQVQAKTTKINYPAKHQNQTQINLIAQDNFQGRVSKMLTSKYTSEIQKLDSFRKTKPKIVYTYSKDSKNIHIDPLKLLKSKLKQQQFNHNMLRNNHLLGRRRIKTQDY